MAETEMACGGDSLSTKPVGALIGFVGICIANVCIYAEN
jgi:hypothetical protein